MKRNSTKKEDRVISRIKDGSTRSKKAQIIASKKTMKEIHFQIDHSKTAGPQSKKNVRETWWII